MYPKKTKHELRCMCSRKPLLAYYGIDSRNRMYLHTKSWKQQRLIHESVTYGPRAMAVIKCRDCLRWTRVTLTDGQSVPRLQPDVPEPKVLKD